MRPATALRSPTLRLGVVQLPNYAGRHAAARALEAAAPLVAAAAAEGAQLVLLPEAFAGYSYVPDEMWPYAERLDSPAPDPGTAPAAAGLAQLAKQHRLALACTLLERTSRDEILNTFVTLAPDGTLRRHHHKAVPAALERFIFVGDDVVPNTPGSRVFELPPGVVGLPPDAPPLRVGVAICYENYLPATWHELAAGAPDLLLAPHCGMLPGVSWASPQAIRDRLGACMASNALAAVLGVPLAVTNKVGTFDSRLPLPLYRHFNASALFFRGSRFPGGGRVVDACGRPVGTGVLGPDTPGYAVGTVSLSAAERPATGAGFAAAATPPLSPRRCRRDGGLTPSDVATLRHFNTPPPALQAADTWNVPLSRYFHAKSASRRAVSAWGGSGAAGNNSGSATGKGQLQ